MPNDYQKINFIKHLVEKGYSNKILLGHDIYSKHRLKKYGGHGFDHLLTRIVPWMKMRGFNEEITNKLMINNPTKMLTIK